MTEEMNKGCEFQCDCIEYKDISYLKIMPICAIYELSIACHDKVNKCKYYKLYTQLKRSEEENAKLKEKLEETRKQVIRYRSYYCKGCYEITEENEKLKEKLEKIKEAITTCLTFHTCQKCKFYKECEMSLEEFILEIIRGEE